MNSMPAALITLLLVAYLALPVLFFQGSGPAKDAKDVLSKGFTDVARGLCILHVALSHLSWQLGWVEWILPGRYSVGFFMFLSGYSLQLSLRNNPRYLDSFAGKRLNRVLVPFLAINLLALLVPMLRPDSPREFATRLITDWFVVEILVLYAVFWILNLKLKPLHSVAAFLVLALVWFYAAKIQMRIGDWWYSNTIFFPIGCLAGATRDSWAPRLFRHRGIALVAAAILFPLFVVLDHSMIVRGLSYLTPIFSIFLLCAISAWRTHPGTNLLAIAGVASLELLVSHSKLIRLMFEKGATPHWIMVALFVPLAVALAWSLNRLIGRFLSGRKPA